MLIVTVTGIICFTILVIVIVFSSSFLEPISDYIEACAEAKRNQEQRFKLIDEWLKKKLKEEKHDNT